MDKITAASPKRLIVVDGVEALAQSLFGDKYEHTLTTTQYDPIEDIYELEKPKWTTILGDESSELLNFGKTIENEVLVNAIVTAKVPSNHLAHAIPYLEDIEKIKRELLGNHFTHKGNGIVASIGNEDRPTWSTVHDIDHSGGGSVLRIQFAIVMKIHDEP